MSKALSIFSALTVFVSVSGTSSFLTHLTLSEIHDSAAYASTNGHKKPISQIANSVFESDSTKMVMNHTKPFVSNGAVHEEDIDLGETLIPAYDRAAQ